MYWYRTQSMFIRWGNSLSVGFHVSNGVKQGGVLSPILFNVYTNDLSVLLNKSHKGGYLYNVLLNHLFYADDLCLITLCSADMQHLLNICEEYAREHDLLFNSSKTQCMVYKPKSLCFSDPCLSLGGVNLIFVECAKYLGTYIELKGNVKDTKRQLCKQYSNANRLLSKFKFCSPEVKCHLFTAFCTNMYCPQFWYGTTNCNINKLRVAYNNSLRRLLKIPTYNSASQMFVSLNIPSFYEILRRSIYSFSLRLTLSCNVFIRSSCLVPVAISSPIRMDPCVSEIKRLILS